MFSCAVQRTLARVEANLREQQRPASPQSATAQSQAEINLQSTCYSNFCFETARDSPTSKTVSSSVNTSHGSWRGHALPKEVASIQQGFSYILKLICSGHPGRGSGGARVVAIWPHGPRHSSSWQVGSQLAQYARATSLVRAM